jgi:hypothetical protein
VAKIYNQKAALAYVKRYGLVDQKTAKARLKETIMIMEGDSSVLASSCCGIIVLRSEGSFEAWVDHRLAMDKKRV